MFKTYFNTTQLSFLFIGTLFFLLSLVFFARKKYDVSVLLLFLSSISIYFFASVLDPFLNLWDERFHALVAKNLINHPLKPTLYDSLPVDMAYDRWDRFHIWLHKQPLFLWQIALSFKLFGINEFTLRLPSAILSSLIIVAGYRSGSLLINKRVGYFTSILFVSSFYIIELVAGRQELEHNDISFLAYVSFSIWAWLEYIYSGKKYWLVVIGIFSGFAILCKWLVGLLVFLGWGVFNLMTYKWKVYKYADIATALIVALLVAIPWQVLTFYWYPNEAYQEFLYNAKHFSTVVEGHGGDNWFHLDQIGIIFGELVSFIILPSLYFFYKKTLHKKLFFSLLINIIGVELFFLIAATKMPSFTLILALPIFISIACFIDHFLEYIENRINHPIFLKTISITFLIILVLCRIDIEELQEKHTLWKKDNIYSRMLTHNKDLFSSLKSSLPKNTVLFNVKGGHYIESMFYTGIPSYKIIPSYKQYKKLNESGYIIALFNSPEITLPDYLANDESVIIISDQLMGYN